MILLRTSFVQIMIFYPGKKSDEHFDLFQVRLQSLHDNLQQDYENMVKEKDAQKDVEKQLRGEVKKLKTMSLSLDEDQEKLFRAKEAIGKLD